MCDSNLSYNEQVLKYVLGGDDSSMEIECPECGKEAKQRDYDRNDGGCINSYYQIDCSHCKYHECNDDFCSHCEATYEVDHSYFDKAANVWNEFSLMLESIAEHTGSHGYGHALEISHAKYFMHKHWDELTNFINPRRDFNDAIKTVLDNGFNHRLEQKIKLAKSI